MAPERDGLATLQRLAPKVHAVDFASQSAFIQNVALMILKATAFIQRRSAVARTA